MVLINYIISLSILTIIGISAIGCVSAFGNKIMIEPDDGLAGGVWGHINDENGNTVEKLKFHSRACGCCKDYKLDKNIDYQSGPYTIYYTERCIVLKNFDYKFIFKNYRGGELNINNNLNKDNGRYTYIPYAPNKASWGKIKSINEDVDYVIDLANTSMSS